MRLAVITTTDTYALRQAVLRDHMDNKNVSFPEDDLPGVVHLGIFDDNDELVATSSWVPLNYEPMAQCRGVQLRGMATAKHVQSSGLGGMLIEAGAARFAEAGFDLLWARARDVALDFYARHNCVVVGDGFLEQATQLPHHVVVRHLGEQAL
jgi:predicted GNAT family N-acyltransferase